MAFIYFFRTRNIVLCIEVAREGYSNIGALNSLVIRVSARPRQQWGIAERLQALIPIPFDQNRCAKSRLPIDMMRQG